MNYKYEIKFKSPLDVFKQESMFAYLEIRGHAFALKMSDDRLSGELILYDPLTVGESLYLAERTFVNSIDFMLFVGNNVETIFEGRRHFFN